MDTLLAGEDSATIESGNYLATPDQYGTLSLPALVFGGDPEYFDSVIRVHVVESFAIKGYFSGLALVTINITDDYYFYFDEETQEPLVIFGTTTDDGGGGTPTSTTVLRYQAIPGTGTGPNPAPVASFTSDDIGSGVVNFTDASSNSPTSWDWDFDDGNMSTKQNPNHTYTALGQSYNVCLTATNANGSDNFCNSVAVATTSILDYSETFELGVFPNPNTGIFTIKFSAAEEENMVLKITDNLGQEIYSEKLGQLVGSYEKQLDLKEYPAGIYNLQFLSDKGSITRPIIIE